MKQHPFIVIMAGGRGERLWPLVRVSRPKACVAPDGRRSLLELTIRRLGPLARRPSDVLIVTTSGQERPIRRVLPPPWRSRVLVEPEPKNTAACIALSAAIAAHRDPSRVMVALPADHWIEPAASFRRSLQAAIELSARDAVRLAVIGVPPGRVHPGLGYLIPGGALAVRPSRPHPCRRGSAARCGARGRGGSRAFRLRQFVEKPSPAAARKLMKAGAFWNAGMFIGQARTFLQLVRRWLPRHARRLSPLGRLAGTSSFSAAARAAYRGLANASFDLGVMAHATDGYLVEGCFAWEDLGSWDSWAHIGSAGRPPIVVGGRNVQAVTANGHVIATVGLDDVVIVQTDDATLICRMVEAQAVREVVRRVSSDPKLAAVR